MPWTKLLADSYAQDSYQRKEEKDKGRELTYAEAIKEALTQALKIDPRVFIMGEGVDDPAGVFGTTLNLHREFGENRVFDLPLSENGFTGFAVGAAITGTRPILVHMRMDFILLAMDQIVNHAAKWCYMFGGSQCVPLTIRCIIGRGWGSGAQHSQSLEGLLMHIPGLKIVCPADAYDVKGLLLASIADNNPVIFVEHRWLFKTSTIVPQNPYLLPLGKGEIKRQGKDITIIAYSLMVQEALQAAEILSNYGIDAEVIDLKTIKPLDKTLIIHSVKRTKRAIVATLDWKTAGVSAELSTIINEETFGILKSPVKRATLFDLPTPASPVLEEAFYKGKEEIVKVAREMCRQG